MTQLETFMASLPTRATSELLTLLFHVDRYYGNNALYLLVGTNAGSYGASQQMAAATSAIRAEIDHRLPPREDPTHARQA